MKTARLNLERLHNDEWFQFYTEVKLFIAEQGVSNLGIDTQYPNFIKLYNDADTALKVTRKSDITKPMTQSDALRNKAYSGLNTIVKGSLNDANKLRSTAAERLKNILTIYGKGHKSYNDRTSAFYNLIQDLKGKSASDITSLGLDNWVTQLENANLEAEKLMRDRYQESSEKSKLRMSQVRTDMDKIYRAILNQIDAMILVNGEEKYKTFVDRLDAIVNQYTLVLALRDGKKSKDDTK